MINTSLTPLLNEKQAAACTGLSVSSLRRRRWLDMEPRYIKLGGAVRYKPEDIQAWIDAQPVRGGVAVA
ncbi:MAG: helix-turn-helix transcriptional regulator [Bryobacteraceae bacterium]